MSYLMHRIGFNSYDEKSKDNRNDDVNLNTLDRTIKSLFCEGDWMDTWESMTKKGDVSKFTQNKTNKEQLIDQALGCLYQAGENSYCFLHRTIQEYLCCTTCTLTWRRRRRPPPAAPAAVASGGDGCGSGICGGSAVPQRYSARARGHALCWHWVVVQGRGRVGREVSLTNNCVCRCVRVGATAATAVVVPRQAAAVAVVPQRQHQWRWWYNNSSSLHCSCSSGRGVATIRLVPAVPL